MCWTAGQVAIPFLFIVMFNNSRFQSSTKNSSAAMASVHETDRMTSLQIAEITGRQHKDVMKAIRNMEPAWEKINGRKFALVDYTDAKGEKRPCYSLTKTESLYIATKFNDEARAKLVIRWEELETGKAKPMMQPQPQYNIPQTYSQALLLAAQQAETIEQQSLTIQAQNEQIQQLEAASAYTKIVLQCKSLTPVTIIASDYGMAAHAFNKLLAGFGVQYRKADTWVLYSRYLGKGYTQTKTHTFTHSDGRQGACVTTHWTQKGRMFIYNFLKQHGVLPTIER